MPVIMGIWILMKLVSKQSIAVTEYRYLEFWISSPPFGIFRISPCGLKKAVRFTQKHTEHHKLAETRREWSSYLVV